MGANEHRRFSPYDTEFISNAAKGSFGIFSVIQVTYVASERIALHIIKRNHRISVFPFLFISAMSTAVQGS